MGFSYDIFPMIFHKTSNFALMIAEGSLFWTQELLHFCLAPGHFAPLAAQGGALGKSREIYVRNAQIQLFGWWEAGFPWPNMMIWLSKTGIEHAKHGDVTRQKVIHEPNMMI